VITTQGTPTLVMMHGHGGDPSTFAGLSSPSQQLDIVTPRAPHDDHGHASWWAAGSFGPTVDDIEQFVIPSAPVIVGGFSQGAAMATVIAAAQTSVCALIVVAGFLPDPPPTLARPIDVLCMHSEDDETVDPFLGARVARWASAAGCRLTSLRYEGGHRWTQRVDDAIVHWIGERSSDVG
jgi:predicted esterase